MCFQIKIWFQNKRAKIKKSSGQVSISQTILNGVWTNSLNRFVFKQQFRFVVRSPPKCFTAWFQKGELAKMLMAQGLYDHSTVPIEDDDEDRF